MDTVAVLYWNIRKNPVCLEILTALCTDRKPMGVMLAECLFTDKEVETALGTGFKAFSSSHPRVRFYASALSFSLENEHLSNYLVAARLDNGAANILLVGVHLPSKLHGQSQNKQARQADTFRLLIEELEQVANTNKSLVFGDFNMNAYEWGMTDRSRGFRTVPTRRLALQSILRTPLTTTPTY